MDEKNVPPASSPVGDARVRAKASEEKPAQEPTTDEIVAKHIADHAAREANKDEKQRAEAESTPLVSEHLAALPTAHSRAFLARFHAQGIHTNARMSEEVFKKALSATLNERL